MIIVVTFHLSCFKFFPLKTVMAELVVYVKVWFTSGFNYCYFAVLVGVVRTCLLPPLIPPYCRFVVIRVMCNLCGDLITKVHFISFSVTGPPHDLCG